MNKLASSSNGKTVRSDYANLAEELRSNIRGEVRFDDGSRALYATDGSNYREVPIGVMIPRDVEDITQTILTANRHGAPILSRGCGTSLAGQCCNVAVVMDMSKYFNQLIEIDLRLLHLGLSDPREGQQVINQMTHPFRRFGNRRQMTEALFGKRGPGVFLQQVHEAQDVAQRGAQIVGNGITERFQFLVGGLQLHRAFDDALLQFRIEPADFIFRAFVFRDVTNVALDHVAVTGLIHVADKLDGNVTTIPCFQGQVFIADIPVPLQSLKHDLVRLDVLKRTKLADGFADHFAAGKSQYSNQERVHIGDASRVHVQNQDAILRRFKQPPVTQFGGADRSVARLRLFRPCFRPLESRVIARRVRSLIRIL